MARRDLERDGDESDIADDPETANLTPKNGLKLVGAPVRGDLLF